MSIKLAKTFISLTMALVFTAAPAFSYAPRAAASTQPQGEAAWLSAESLQAMEWLTEKVPAPTTGDELALISMVRAQWAGADTAAAAYIDAAQQTTTETTQSAALRALALAACGQTAQARQSGLLESLGDTAALLSADDNSATLALILFGYAGAPVPEGLDTAALARGLSGTQGEDGSFGENVGQTARTLAALAFYAAGDEMISAAVDKGTAWLAARQASFGGFEEAGALSAAATAEVVLALTALGLADLGNNGPTPAQALLNFQREDGGFAPDLDSPADVELSALCALACIANDRHNAGLPWVFDLEDIPQAVDTAPEAASQVQSESPGISLVALDQLPGLVLPGVGSVPGIIVLAALAVLVILLIATVIAYFKTRSRLLAQHPQQGSLYGKQAQPSTGRKPKDLSSFPSVATTRRPARKKRKLKKGAASQPASQAYIYMNESDNSK